MAHEKRSQLILRNKIILILIVDDTIERKKESTLSPLFLYKYPVISHLSQNAIANDASGFTEQHFQEVEKLKRRCKEWCDLTSLPCNYDG